MSRQKHNRAATAAPPPPQKNVFALLDNDDDDEEEEEEKLEEQQQSPSNNTTSTCFYDASVDASDASTGNQRPRDRIAQLPDAIIQLMTHTFFDDASAVALCQTQQLTFRLLKDSYRVRGEVEFMWNEKNEKDVEGKSQQQEIHSSMAREDSLGPTLTSSQQKKRQYLLPSHEAEDITTPSGSSAISTATSIEVAYPCLMPMQFVLPLHPEEGALDPRSYKLPTYSLTLVNDAVADNTLAASSSDGRPLHRIGIPQNIRIRTPQADGRVESVEERANVLFDALPATITTSLRMKYCSPSALQSLTRLTKLQLLDFQGVSSLATINEIARLLPQLRVLRLNGIYQWQNNLLVATEKDEVLHLPPALEELYLGKVFENMEDRLALHENLRVLHYDGHKKSMQQWKLPDSLTELHLGYHFNHDVDSWTPPASLRTLIFGDQFNQDISKVIWPSGLTRLVFGRFFRQSLVNVKLPDSMLHLELKSNETNMFGIIRDGADRSENPFKIPPHLESFLIDSVFPSDTRGPQVFALDLPQTVIRVKLSVRVILDIPNLKWPSSITDLQLDAQHMTFYENFPLPPRLRRLELNGRGERPLKKFSVPTTLESLSLPNDSSCSIELLQSLLQSCARSLQTLKLGKCPQRSMSSLVLPKNLTHLELPTNWDCPVSELPKFPSSLKYLKFGVYWDQPLKGLKLPSSLLRLHFGRTNRDVTPLNAILPKNLRELSFPSFRCDKVRTTLPKLKVPQFCSVFAVFVTSR